MKTYFPENAAGRAGTERHGRGKRVLLVDDEPVVLAATALLITRAGFQVRTAGSAEEALVRLQSEAFDLVVTDYRMRGRHGDAVVLAARNTVPATPVMLMTGLVDDLPAWMRSGENATPIVRKPFHTAELLAEMHRVIAGAEAPVAVQA